MSPYVPHRWMVDRLPRAIQWFPGVSCMHPVPIDVTVMGDTFHTATCPACGAYWYWRKANRW